MPSGWTTRRRRTKGPPEGHPFADVAAVVDTHNRAVSLMACGLIGSTGWDSVPVPCRRRLRVRELDLENLTVDRGRLAGGRSRDRSTRAHRSGSRPSVTRPPAIRYTFIPSTNTLRPVAGTPRTSALCAPAAVQWVATGSASPKTCCRLICRSARVRLAVATDSSKPAKPGSWSGALLWSTNAGRTTRPSWRRRQPRTPSRTARRCRCSGLT